MSFFGIMNLKIHYGVFEEILQTAIYRNTSERLLPFSHIFRTVLTSLEHFLCLNAALLPTLNFSVNCLIVLARAVSRFQNYNICKPSYTDYEKTF